jgi:hypothetical protein
MATRLVLCSDGTGNSSAKAQKTNVWRIFQSLDQTQPDQLAHYDDGVGTSSNKYLAAFGGAFGWGLKRNVIDLYKFVCRNWKPGVQIYGFGFSRGAFTIRMVVGLIASQGLVQADTEEGLNRGARAAFRVYRWKNHWKWYRHIFWIFRLILGWALAAFDAATGHRYKDVKRVTTQIDVRFLGLWDTVEAYQMPVVEIKRAIDFWLFPMSFASLSLSPFVQEACHALAMDEERETFHPTLWDPDKRIDQVWFAGVHSNVGGGYDEDQQSYVPFSWIAERAQTTGLRFDQAALGRIAANASPYARLYDSRRGVAALYRYSPRTREITEGTPDPLIHWSVIMRMGDGSDRYAPIILPPRFRILAPDHKSIVRMADAVTLSQSGDSQMAALGTALLPLGTPSEQQVSWIWDFIWWRRVIYFATLSAVALVALYPLIGKVLNRWFDERDAHAVSQGIVDELAGMVSAFIPSFLSPWLDALRDQPEAFMIIGGALAYFYFLGALLGKRIEDRAFAAWQTRPQTYPDYARQAHAAARFLWVASLVSLGIFTVVFLRPTVQAKWLWGVLTVVIILLAITRSWQAARLDAIVKTGKPPMRAGMILGIAHFFRTNGLSIRFSQIFTNDIVPLVFLLMVFAVAFSLANKAIVGVVSTTDDKMCKPSGTHSEKENVGMAQELFDARDPCWATGLVLEKGATYRVVMQIVKEWFDEKHPADLGGFPSDTQVHIPGAGLKRWWSANWFQPIARIGVLGNEEYALAPNPPYQEKRAGVDPPAERHRLIAQITPHSTGELFVYVNDAAMFYPKPGRFYCNNIGTAKVCVERVRPDDPNWRGECTASLPDVQAIPLISANDTTPVKLRMDEACEGPQHTPSAQTKNN